MPASTPLVDRFWAKVNKSTDCWLWVGGKCSKGYGCIGIGGRKIEAAHRVSWLLHFGKIPDGMFVCHKCDVPACVNPDHLFLGTHGDNMRDMESKHRCNHPKGAAVKHLAKFNADIVTMLRKEYAEAPFNISQRARELGVWPNAVWSVLKRETWKHI